MVSAYETEARDFLMRNNIKMSIMLKDREANRLWRDNAKRNCYSVYIRKHKQRSGYARDILGFHI